MKHTPIPWRTEVEYVSQERNTVTGYTLIYSGTVFITKVNHIGVAERIIQAVNTRESLRGEHANLLATVKELLEICRWKCSASDSVVLPHGRTNHQALIDATALLDAIENKRMVTIENHEVSHA